MKKIISLCAILLCAYQITKAQTQKGNQDLSVFLGYQHLSTTSSSPLSLPVTQANKANSFDIGPSYGYFIANGLELGGVLSYSHSTSETTNTQPTVSYNSKNTNNGFGVNLSLKKYVLYENKFGFRVGPYATYGYTKSVTDNIVPVAPATTDNIHDWGAGGTLDLVFYPSTHLGIAANLATLSYTHSKTSGDNDNTNNFFGLNFINSGLALSVFWVLN